MALILSIRNPEQAPAGTATRFEVEGDGALIGRSANCDWNLPDPDNIVSSRHAEIRREADKWILKDISTNGTFLNGRRIPPDKYVQLNHGDKITVGTANLVMA